MTNARSVAAPRERKLLVFTWLPYPMSETVTVYGPPTRMPGMVKRPSERVRAEYVVPEGSCMAATLAFASGLPASSVTMPLMEAVVTPCATTTPGAATTRNTTARHTPSKRFMQTSARSWVLGDRCDHVRAG